MLDAHIPSLIFKMAIPTMISFLITSIYNMADTYFVSYLGTSATAAVGVNYSLDQIILMAGSFVAIGANSYIARLLGAKEENKAAQVLSTAFFTAFVTGLVVMVFGLANMEPLVRLLGAKDAVIPYAIQYAGYVLYAAPFWAGNFVMNQCLRSEGSSLYSMIGMSIGGILNIALDPIFIFVLGWGVAGASAATAISKFVSFSVLILPYLRRRTIIPLSLRLIKYSREIITEVSKMGSSSLFRFGMSAVSTILLNNLAGSYSDSALAAISVVNRIMMFLMAAIMGFGQGFQPVAGYNWGARRYDRVWSSYRFAAVTGVAFMSAISLITGIFAENLLLLFTDGDLEMVALGCFCLRLQCLAMPVHAWGVIVNSLYAGLGKARGAVIISLSRQGICFIPVLIILPLLFGVWGVASIQAAADALSLIILLPFAVTAGREIKGRILTDNAPPADRAEGFVPADADGKEAL